jgi:hypothetical protein
VPDDLPFSPHQVILSLRMNQAIRSYINQMTKKAFSEYSNDHVSI